MHFNYVSPMFVMHIYTSHLLATLLNQYSKISKEDLMFITNVLYGHIQSQISKYQEA